MCEIQLIGYGIWAKGGESPGQETFEMEGIDPLSSGNMMRVGGVEWSLPEIRAEITEIEPPNCIEGFCMKGIYFKGELDIVEGTFDIKKLLLKAKKLRGHECVCVESVWYDGKEIECIDIDIRIKMDFYDYDGLDRCCGTLPIKELCEPVNTEDEHAELPF